MSDAPAKSCAMTTTRREPLSITAIILTRDEEIHLERCIASIDGIVARIVVVDSFSTDATLDIAERLGAETLRRAFRNHADQFQWGVDAAPPPPEWSRRRDADA
jgi:glycosyltransferase involved in cell wall biosynthesis